MEEIIRILMERDGNSRKEAKRIVNEVIGMLEECDFDPMESEEIFMMELGLEPDYLIDLLFDM